MKNLLFMITILLLVSCNKEQRTIKGKWEVIQHSYRSNGNQVWQKANWKSPNLTVTKNTWEPYIEGKCVIDGESIIPDIQTGYTYSYDYIESIDQLYLNMFNSNGDWIKKLIFERL